MELWCRGASFLSRSATFRSVDSCLLVHQTRLSRRSAFFIVVLWERNIGGALFCSPDLIVLRRPASAWRCSHGSHSERVSLSLRVATWKV
jgi:hypothetical protein